MEAIGESPPDPESGRASCDTGPIPTANGSEGIVTPSASKVNGDRYHVEYLPIHSIEPSPENDGIYGKIDRSDEAFIALWNSIHERGLEEPLILTVDGYILSGHRRFAACQLTNVNNPMPHQTRYPA
jgi:ParB/Sulfiredoxin domain